MCGPPAPETNQVASAPPCPPTTTKAKALEAAACGCAHSTRGAPWMHAQHPGACGRRLQQGHATPRVRLTTHHELQQVGQALSRNCRGGYHIDIAAGVGILPVQRNVEALHAPGPREGWLLPSLKNPCMHVTLAQPRLTWARAARGAQARARQLKRGGCMRASGLFGAGLWRTASPWLPAKTLHAFADLITLSARRPHPPARSAAGTLGWSAAQTQSSHAPSGA